MLTRSLARELGPEIRVNAIAPGPGDLAGGRHGRGPEAHIVERTALKRAGSPDDVAKAALFFATGAPYVTGEVLAVDGGRLARRRPTLAASRVRTSSEAGVSGCASRSKRRHNSPMRCPTPGASVPAPVPRAGRAPRRGSPDPGAAAARRLGARSARRRAAGRGRGCAGPTWARPARGRRHARPLSAVRAALATGRSVRKRSTRLMKSSPSNPTARFDQAREAASPGNSAVSVAIARFRLARGRTLLPAATKYLRHRGCARSMTPTSREWRTAPGLCTVTRTRATAGNSASTMRAISPASASTRRKRLSCTNRARAWRPTCS